MDRRQRRTRRAIYQALEELMAEEHYASVTVAQLIERADIGRSTFYAHFDSKDDLLDQLCEELFAHVFEGVETDPHTHEALRTSSLEGMLAHLLYHLRDSHAGIGVKLLAEEEPHFTAYFRGQLGDFLATRLPERSSWVPEDLLRAMVVGCFCQLISWWHAQQLDASPESLAHWYVRTLGWESHRPAAEGPRP